MKRCWCGNEALEEYSSQYRVCTKCHTLVTKYDVNDSLYKVSDEESDFYGENYWAKGMLELSGLPSLSALVDAYLRGRVPYWTENVLKYAKLGGCVAEVGCGLGQLQYVLKRIGYQQLAYELSPDICRYMEDTLGVSAHCGSFERSDKPYDAILAFDLFEHLLEPEEFLSACADSLQTDGVLMMQTPCYDAALSYDEMLIQKPRFKELLRPEQHLYLFSRESIAEILHKHGFVNVVFEPAYFGDDYDMFFVASKGELCQNTKDEIDEYLNRQENGRLVKAMIALQDENREWEKRYLQADRDREERLHNMQKLEELLRVNEADREDRLKQAQTLERRLEESEADRAARLEQVKILEQRLEKSERDRAARLEQMKILERHLEESETDRAARLEQMKILERRLEESEADRAARLEQMKILERRLEESEADRAARKGCNTGNPS
ncbi:MAG TPA: methyltransferase domain-containing protein [Candidatus Fournierella merdavium]|nr:methyltransferase domain-containing protein [Candidatus Fournierella merdavium]